MAASLYDISVRSYLQSLDALCGVLDKTSAHCAENDMAPDDLLPHRLADDMLPLTFQLHMATTHSLGTIKGIREGLFAPPRGIPELDYAGFRQRIEDAGKRQRTDLVQNAADRCRRHVASAGRCVAILSDRSMRSCGASSLRLRGAMTS